MIVSDLLEIDYETVGKLLTLEKLRTYARAFVVKENLDPWWTHPAAFPPNTHFYRHVAHFPDEYRDSAHFAHALPHLLVIARARGENIIQDPQELNYERGSRFCADGDKLKEEALGMRENQFGIPSFYQ